MFTFSTAARRFSRSSTLCPRTLNSCAIISASCTVEPFPVTSIETPTWAVVRLGLADDVLGLGHGLDRVLGPLDRGLRNRDGHGIVLSVGDLGLDPGRAEYFL